MRETTTTKAVTPTIMPSSVSAERSLCAQIADTASFRVSINFTALLKHKKVGGQDLQDVAGYHEKSCKSCPTTHSHLKASIGFKRAAFQAGHSPKMIPTAAEMPTPTPMAHKGT